jgi:L-2-hydroxyglutarate oxidase LhgO
MEPALHPSAIAALHAPDAGNVIPYEYAVALAENAVDNGVELRIRREVVAIDKKNHNGSGQVFQVSVRHWEPKSYVDAREKMGKRPDGEECANHADGGGMGRLVFRASIAVSSASVMIKGIIMMLDNAASDALRLQSAVATLVVFVVSAILLFGSSAKTKKPASLKDLVEQCSPPEGKGEEGKVQVTDMFTGGSGSWNAVKGVTVGNEIVKCRYVINCAGSASDKVARMIGDDSFYIKPRLGDYLLLNRNQVCFFMLK